MGRDLSAIVGYLFELIDVPFERSSELQRQVIAAFAFGMVSAEGMRRGCQPPEVHVLAITVLVDAFKYANHQAVDFAADLIAAASNEAHHPSMSAIIHRGIDGHMQWERGDHDDLKRNLVDTLARVCSQ